MAHPLSLRAPSQRHDSVASQSILRATCALPRYWGQCWGSCKRCSTPVFRQLHAHQRQTPGMSRRPCTCLSECKFHARKWSRRARNKSGSRARGGSATVLAAAERSTCSTISDRVKVEAAASGLDLSRNSVSLGVKLYGRLS